MQVKKDIRLSGSKWLFWKLEKKNTVCRTETAHESARGARKVNSDLAEKWRNRILCQIT